jgi:hypothetical protein
MKNCRKIKTRLICPIIVHFLEIDEKLNCLLGTIQTFFLQIKMEIIKIEVCHNKNYPCHGFSSASFSATSFSAAFFLRKGRSLANKDSVYLKSSPACFSIV